MIIKETFNVEDIKEVLCHPDIYDSIIDDSCKSSEFFEPPITDDYRYVVGYVKGAPIGVMVYHKYKDGNECHVQVLPEYRKEYAKQFGQQSLEFRGTVPLYAEIPSLYVNVLKFALLNNFEVIDIIDDGYIKNGVSHLVNVLKYKG